MSNENSDSKVVPLHDTREEHKSADGYKMSTGRDKHLKAARAGRHVQMSEAFINCAVLALSGGFQDAYTYYPRT